LTVEITGNESKISAFLELMEPFGVRDITRTGKVAMLANSEASCRSPEPRRERISDRLPGIGAVTSAGGGGTACCSGAL